MNMAIVCTSFPSFSSLTCSIDACIYYYDGEIVVGSSVKQLARTSPNNVIYHPMHYLDGRMCKVDCNKFVVRTMKRCYF